jgi:hypothetical protein
LWGLLRHLLVGAASRLVADRLGMKLIMAADIDHAMMGET